MNAIVLAGWVPEEWRQSYAPPAISAPVERVEPADPIDALAAWVEREGAAALARKLICSDSAVAKWLSKANRPSEHFQDKLAEITGTDVGAWDYFRLKRLAQVRPNHVRAANHRCAMRAARAQ